MNLTQPHLENVSNVEATLFVIDEASAELSKKVQSAMFHSEAFCTKIACMRQIVGLVGTGKADSLNPTIEEQAYALKLLRDASQFAQDQNVSVWEFAVEIDELLRRGVSRFLLRWLSSREAIEHRIEAVDKKDPRRQFLVAPNLAFREHSCFVLTKQGMEMLSRIEIQIAAARSAFNEQRLRELPSWCGKTRVLTFQGKVVKHFRWPAPNQEIVIAAFDELGWPSQIDDPLPKTNVCPKRRLHDTIKCLNRNQLTQLIRFRGDGTGEAAKWELEDLADDDD